MTNAARAGGRKDKDAMRDIGARIKRYRLSRYRAPDDPWSRYRKWLVLAAAVWVLWAGFVSDHSFYRLWRVHHDATRERAELERTLHEVDRLGADLNDPQARKERTESVLREGGWAKENEIIYRVQEGVPDSLKR